MARRRRRKKSDDALVGWVVVGAAVVGLAWLLVEALAANPGVFAALVGVAGAAWWYRARRLQLVRERVRVEIDAEKRAWRETPFAPGRFNVTLTAVSGADLARLHAFLTNLRSFHESDPVEVAALLERVEHVAPQTVAEEIDQVSAVRLKVALEERGAKAKIREGREAVTAPRKAIPERVKHEVWRRDGGRCVDCGSRERLEFDHIVPVSKGGANTARNIELRCESCNRSKGARI